MLRCLVSCLSPPPHTPEEFAGLSGGGWQVAPIWVLVGGPDAFEDLNGGDATALS